MYLFVGGLPWCTWGSEDNLCSFYTSTMGVQDIELRSWDRVASPFIC